MGLNRTHGFNGSFLAWSTVALLLNSAITAAQVPILSPAPLDASTGVATLAPVATPAAAPNIVSFTLDTNFYTNAKDYGSDKNSSTIEEEITVDFALPSNYKIELYTGGSKELHGSNYGGTWYDSSIMLENAIYKSDMFNFSASAKYIIPTSEESNHETLKNWGAEFYPTFLLKPWKEGDMFFSYRLRPVYQHFDYDSDTIVSGDSKDFYNIDDVLTLKNRFVFQATSYFRFYLFYNYSTSWNALGERVNDTWSSTQQMEFNLNTTVSLSIGHTNHAKFFGKNGESNSVNVYDSSTSKFFATLELTF